MHFTYDTTALPTIIQVFRALSRSYPSGNIKHFNNCKNIYNFCHFFSHKCVFFFNLLAVNGHVGSRLGYTRYCCSCSTNWNWFWAVSDDKMKMKKHRKPSNICFSFSSELLLSLSNKRAVAACSAGCDYRCFIYCHQFGGNLTGSSEKKQTKI